MDMNSVVRMGAEVFQKQLGSQGAALDIPSIVTALMGLLGDGSGTLDLAGLVQKFSSSGLGALASSWLGDGANAGVSGDQLIKALGAGAVSQFASQLGLTPATATEGLEAAVPVMVDKASSGGSLLEAAGGVGGLMGMAGKLFGN